MHAGTYPRPTSPGQFRPVPGGRPGTRAPTGGLPQNGGAIRGPGICRHCRCGRSPRFGRRPGRQHLLPGRGLARATGIYQSMLADGDEIRSLAASAPLTTPVLAIGGGGGHFTAGTVTNISRGAITSLQGGVGHYVALEAPDALAEAILDFTAHVDQARRDGVDVSSRRWFRLRFTRPRLDHGGAARTLRDAR